MEFNNAQDALDFDAYVDELFAREVVDFVDVYDAQDDGWCSGCERVLCTHCDKNYDYVV